MKPRVLIVAPSAYVLSGLATWLDYLQPGLEGMGWDVLIGLVEGPKHHRPQKYLDVHRHKHWITIPCMTGTTEGRQQAIVRVMKETAPDIVVTVNMPDAIPGTQRYRQTSKRYPKLVMTVHGVQPDLFDDARQYREILDAVVCTNQLTCQLARERGAIAEGRIHYAPYGVQLNALEDKGRSDDLLRIAYAGRFEHDQKRVEDLAPILQSLSDDNVPFELMLAGSGPEEEKLKEQLSRFMEKGRVRFLGRLDAETLAQEVYRKADVLLLTSSWETGPIVIWEAMAYGAVVVSSDYIGSGVENALQDEHNSLIFPVGAPAQAAKCISRLWHETGLWGKLRENAWKMVEMRYSINASVKQWDTVLKRILMTESQVNTAVAPVAKNSGRLDRILGPKFGEYLRRSTKRHINAVDPGDEWPHTHSGSLYHEAEFWEQARRLDRREK